MDMDIDISTRCLASRNFSPLWLKKGCLLSVSYIFTYIYMYI